MIITGLRRMFLCTILLIMPLCLVIIGILGFAFAIMVARTQEDVKEEFLETIGPINFFTKDFWDTTKSIWRGESL